MTDFIRLPDNTLEETLPIIPNTQRSDFSRIRSFFLGIISFTVPSL